MARTVKVSVLIEFDLDVEEETDDQVILAVSKTFDNSTTYGALARRSAVAIGHGVFSASPPPAPRRRKKK